MEKTINITEEDVLIVPIAKDGIETGEVLTFDPDDIDLAFKYQEMLDKDRQNRQWLNNQITIIQKKQDYQKKGRYMTANEEAIVKATKEFFEKEEQIYNIFLGENGVGKLLCGRKLGWTTLMKIDKVIDENILPNLKLTYDSVKNKIMKKYEDVKDENVI